MDQVSAHGADSRSSCRRRRVRWLRITGAAVLYRTVASNEVLRPLARRLHPTAGIHQVRRCLRGTARDETARAHP